MVIVVVVLTVSGISVGINIVFHANIAGVTVAVINISPRSENVNVAIFPAIWAGPVIAAKIARP